MKLLALDTSSIACTVALSNGDEVLQRHAEQAREHTRLLMPMIEDLLQQANMALHELDGIVLGNGPGSFIGMRIATSVAQGLAHGAGLPLVPVSSLAAVAAEVLQNSDASRVAVTQDAHMNEVYFGLYGRGPEHLPEALLDERLQSCDSIAELSAGVDDTLAYAGLGWQRYPELLAANCRLLTLESTVLVPRAEYLIKLAATAERVDPAAVVPSYLRQQVAMQPQKRKT